MDGNQGPEVGPEGDGEAGLRRAGRGRHKSRPQTAARVSHCCRRLFVPLWLSARDGCPFNVRPPQET